MHGCPDSGGFCTGLKTSEGREYNVSLKKEKDSPNGKKSNLAQDQFEPIVSQPVELDALGTELTICFQDIDGPCEIRTCYGDICKIVNVLRDYARILQMVSQEWDMQICQRVDYELYAEKLEQIAKKYQTGIGYDYDKAIEKCQKRRRKKSDDDDDDVGGEAMAMSVRKSKRIAKSKPEAGTLEKGDDNEI